MTTITPELEKVARAHYERSPWILQTPVPGRVGPLMLEQTWEQIGSVARDRLMDHMAAALQALLPVSDETVEAMAPDMVAWLDGATHGQPQAARNAFHAAINHITGERS